MTVRAGLGATLALGTALAGAACAPVQQQGPAMAPPPPFDMAACQADQRAQRRSTRDANMICGEYQRAAQMQQQQYQQAVQAQQAQAAQAHAAQAQQDRCNGQTAVNTGVGTALGALAGAALGGGRGALAGAALGAGTGFLTGRTDCNQPTVVVPGPGGIGYASPPPVVYEQPRIHSCGNDGWGRPIACPGQFNPQRGYQLPSPAYRGW